MDFRGVLVIAAVVLGASAPAPKLPRGVVSAPTEQQILAAYPPAARAANIAGFAEITCTVNAGKPGHVSACRVVRESPEGMDFGKWAVRLAEARLLMAPADDPQQWRSVRVAVQWSPASAGSGLSASIAIGQPRPAETPVVSIVPRPPGAPSPPPSPPDDDRARTVGPCAWASIGPEGQAEFIQEAAAREPDFGAVIAVHADWRDALERCDPALLDDREERVLWIIETYAKQQAYLALLAPYGLDAAKIDFVAARAPIATRAASYLGLVDGLEKPEAIWDPVFKPLGLSTPPNWPTASPQMLVVAYLKTAHIYEGVVQNLDPAAREYRSRSIRMDFREELYSAPIAAPIWRRQPTPEELAQSFPPTAIRKNSSATAVYDCRVTAKGSMQACIQRSASKNNPWRDGLDELDLVENCFAVAALDADGKPVDGRTVRVTVVWPANPK